MTDPDAGDIVRARRLVPKRRRNLRHGEAKAMRVGRQPADSGDRVRGRESVPCNSAFVR